MYENEILAFLFGSVVLVFVGIYRDNIKRLPASHWLLASFVALWLAWGATNLEHLFLPAFFNVIEHFGYALNGILLFAWCWFAMRNGKAAHYG